VPSPEPVLVDVPELLEVPEFVVVEVVVLLEEPEFVDVEEVPDTAERSWLQFGLVKPGSQLQMQNSATSMGVPWLLQRASRVQPEEDRKELPA